MKTWRLVAGFYGLAFAISWTGYIPLLLHWPGRAWLLALVLPGIGPAVAAWIVDRDAFRRFMVRTNRRFLLLSAALPCLFLLAGNGLSALVYPRAVIESPAANSRMFPLLIAMALAANVWEEVGWRGCALRRLQEVCPPYAAALIVGVMWAAWHLPLFLWPGLGMSHYPFGWWALSCVATSVVMASLWNRTGGSLWCVTTYHVAKNISGAALGLHTFRMEALVVWTVAAALLWHTSGWLGSRPKGKSKDRPTGPCSEAQVNPPVSGGIQP